MQQSTVYNRHLIKKANGLSGQPLSSITLHYRFLNVAYK